jgi:hypothetical protein
MRRQRLLKNLLDALDAPAHPAALRELLARAVGATGLDVFATRVQGGSLWFRCLDNLGVRPFKHFAAAAVLVASCKNLVGVGDHDVFVDPLRRDMHSSAICLAQPVQGQSVWVRRWDTMGGRHWNHFTRASPIVRCFESMPGADSWDWHAPQWDTDASAICFAAATAVLLGCSPHRLYIFTRDCEMLRLRAVVIASGAVGLPTRRARHAWTVCAAAP